MSKRFFLANTILQKCPRCQEGDLYIKPFNIKAPVNMHKECPVCGQLYEPEPGFYYGAMFLSYIISGFFFSGVVAVCMLVFGMNVNPAIGVMLVVAALSYFFLLRFSRSLWINLLIKYDPKAKNSDQKKSFGY
ncbi:MAG: DUF983 domain-containing protein [Lewinellaceae bacterium]|nr:DUF983 domain-containing protein [Lewinellaceae bacterium]